MTSAHDAKLLGDTTRQNFNSPVGLVEIPRLCKLAKDSIEYFTTGRVFVSAEPDEDLSGIAAIVGEDSFVLGSDYPHGDPSRQEDLMAEFRERDDRSQTMVEKMLSDNPKRLYGI